MYTDKKTKITIMKLNYRITIFTTEKVIERDFSKKEIAISTIMDFRKNYDDFRVGTLSKRIKGKWNTIFSISDGRCKTIYYL